MESKIDGGLLMAVMEYEEWRGPEPFELQPANCRSAIALQGLGEIAGRVKSPYNCIL